MCMYIVIVTSEDFVDWFLYVSWNEKNKDKKYFTSLIVYRDVDKCKYECLAAF